MTKLLETDDKKGHLFLLQQNLDLADLKLALLLKKVCYETWTSEPTKAQNAALALKSLVKVNPNEEIKASSFWVSGISEITKGNLESAIKNLDKSAEIFRSINKEPEAAQTQVSKLYVLALLGKYDEAIKCGEENLKIFEKCDDELAAGKIEKNIGNIFMRQEIYQKAKKYFLSACKRFIKIQNYEELIMAENGLATAYLALNDFRKAEKFYFQALNQSKKTRLFVTQAEIEASIGNLTLFRGKLKEALNFLELSRQKFESLKMPHQTAVAELEIADAYLELNLAAEAFSIYEKVTEQLHKLKMQGEEARARANFGKVAAVLHKNDLAKNELKKSARLYIAENNKVGAAAVKLAQANLELDSGNFKNALKILEEAEKLLSESENLRQKLFADWLKGEILLNLGEYKTAQTLLEKTYTEAEKQEQKNVAYASLNSLGKLSLKTGASRQAEKYFKKAIKIVEILRAPLPAEEFRMAFLADKLAPFENLAKLYLAEKDFKKVFYYVEKSRSRSLAESLDTDFVKEQTAGSAKLTKKLENLREELNWFYSRLNRAETAEIGELQTEASKREKQIADVMRQIASLGKTDFPMKSKRESQQDELKLLQKRLGKQKALIEFVRFDNLISAFVITDEKIHFAENLASEDEILSLLQGLQFQFGTLRFGMDYLDDFKDELKNRTDFYLQKLFEKLFAPFAHRTENRDLIVVPVAAVHYIPFHALHDGEKYLIETREIVYAPSATIWRKLAEKSVKKPKNSLLFGFADENIPLVGREIETLEKIFDKSKTFAGEQATFSNFTKNAPEFDILHIACHGQFRPDNPLFSSLHLADGWITVRDICSQNLKAGLVALSACETGLNEVFAGDEILGLARGFLSAGASSLVLSLWTVNDEAAMLLMKNFYENVQRGEGVSTSLAKAQRKFIGEKAHPYFWSPFVLIGR